MEQTQARPAMCWDFVDWQCTICPKHDKEQPVVAASFNIAWMANQMSIVLLAMLAAHFMLCEAVGSGPCVFLQQLMPVAAQPEYNSCLLCDWSCCCYTQSAHSSHVTYTTSSWSTLTQFKSAYNVQQHHPACHLLQDISPCNRTGTSPLGTCCQ